MSRKPDNDLDALLRKTLGDTSSPTEVDCPDPGTLAAWAERSLAPEERTMCTRHVATCRHCQASLAAFAATGDAFAPPRSGWREWLSPAFAGWMRPLAAVATAGLVLSIGVRFFPDAQQLAPRSASDDVAGELAASRSSAEAPGPPTANETSGRPASAPMPKKEARVDRTPRPQATAVPGGMAAKAERDRIEDLSSWSRDEGAPRALEERTGPAGRFSGNAAPTQQRLRRFDELEGQAPPSREQESFEPSPAFRDEAPAAGVRRAPEAEEPEAARSLARGPQDAVGGLDEAAPSERWRLRGVREIEKSADGGATWEAVFTAEGRLYGVHSPAPGVVWAFGEAGAVLFRSAAGTWSSRPVPAPHDLVELIAADREAATLRSETGDIWTTRDAGRSWTSK